MLNILREEWIVLLADSHPSGDNDFDRDRERFIEELKMQE